MKILMEQDIHPERFKEFLREVSMSGASLNESLVMNVCHLTWLKLMRLVSDRFP